MEFESDDNIFFYSTILNKETPEITWQPDRGDDEPTKSKEIKVYHSLLVKRAILGSEAKEGELQHVEFTTNGSNGEEVTTPLVYLKFGSEFQAQIDLKINNFIRFKLVKGFGPIHIIGQHMMHISENQDSDEDESLSGESDVNTELMRKRKLSDLNGSVSEVQKKIKVMEGDVPDSDDDLDDDDDDDDDDHLDDEEALEEKV